jgi:hypothetical protein
MNKEDKDAVYEMEKIVELSPEELENTAGGREIRRSEWDKVLQIKARLNYTMACLYSNGRNAEISGLGNRYNEALYRWKEDIANSPEDSADIDFSKYFRI